MRPAVEYTGSGRLDDPRLVWQERTAEDAVVIAIRNRHLDAFLAPQLSELLARFVRSSRGSKLVLDLGRVDFMDASALGAIVYAFRVMDAEFHLVGVGERIRKLMRSTGVDRLFDLDPGSRNA